MAVQDNDGTATITLTAPATATEGEGTVQGTIEISAVSTVTTTVGLSSSDVTAVQVPGGVVIPAGQTTATFPIHVVNDTKIDGTQSAMISAQVFGWTGDTSPIDVLDNENTLLTLTVPTTINEGSSSSGTVTISGTLPSALVVTLSSNTTSRLTVPATATIAAGATSASFTISAPNNTLTDGSAAVIISASTAGFTGTTGTTTVLDNDVHHYAFSTIGATQTRGVPFSVTITAKDVNDVTITTYTAPATLSASGTAGQVSITPTATTAFTAGVWTGNVTVNAFDSGITLTAGDGAGHTGASNAFNVGVGTLHHFAWDTQAGRARGASVNATVTAQDLGSDAGQFFQRHNQPSWVHTLRRIQCPDPDIHGLFRQHEFRRIRPNQTGDFRLFHQLHRDHHDCDRSGGAGLRACW